MHDADSNVYHLFIVKVINEHNVAISMKQTFSFMTGMTIVITSMKFGSIFFGG